MSKERSVLFLIVALLLAPTTVLVAGSNQDEFEIGDIVEYEFGSEIISGEVIEILPTGWVRIECEVRGRLRKRIMPPDRLSLVEASQSKQSDPAPIRLWTDATGKFKIKATLLSNKNGKVELKKEDGRVVTLPIKKLSEDDRQFLAKLAAKDASETDPNNPFSGGVELDQSSSGANSNEMDGFGTFGARRRSPAKRIAGVMPEFGTNVVDIFVDEWNVVLDPATESKTNRSIRYQHGIKSHEFHTKVSPLVVSNQKRFAFTVCSNPFVKNRSTLVLFDLRNGKADIPIEIPFQDIEALAISDDGKLIATIGEDRGSKNAGLSIWSIDGNSAKQETNWRTAKFGRQNGFKPTAGLFTENGRLLTAGNNIILWDVEQATDLYSVEGIEPESFAFSPNNKLVAAQHDDLILIVELATGKCLGNIETSDDSKSRLAFSPSGQFLAVQRTGSGDIHVWDMGTREMVRELSASSKSFGAHDGLAWVKDDYLLIDGEDLVDVSLRVPIWKYSGAKRQSITSFNDGRFWQLGKSRLKYLKLPHKDLTRETKHLDPDDLLVLKPGAEIELKLDLPFRAEEEEEIYNHLTAALKGNGVSVRNGANLTMMVSVKKLNSETMDVSDFFDHFGRKGTQEVSFTPSKSSVELKKGNELIWSRTAVNRPGHVFQINSGESAQQAANRLCQPNFRFFTGQKVPKLISRLPGGRPLGETKIADAFE